MNQRTTPILFTLGLLITVPSFAQVAYVYCDEFYSDSFEYQELGVGITGLETETSHTTTVSGAGTLFYEIGVE